MLISILLIRHYCRHAAAMLMLRHCFRHAAATVDDVAFIDAAAARCRC